ncbi:MAG TPA: FecR domain-containing protein [Bryobacteraceae bacterium]|jgi:hypothetical protein
MLSRHVSHQLAAHLEGHLSPRDAESVERHLAGCPQCRQEREQVRLGISALDQLPLAQPPDAIWASIESAIQVSRTPVAPSFAWWKPALAIVTLVAVALLIPSLTHVRGRWIETDSSSTAHVAIGDIGSVDISPNTRLRIVADRPNEHRLSLKHGEIHARISAPPKLFFVDTASATAEDLGCEYSLQADDDGSGILHVTLGWVSFQWKGLESLVPAGASCRTSPRVGPGIPYFDDAPQAFQQALGSNSLDTILATARLRDTLSLWHLISRVGVADRARVVDRIAALSPLPADVSRQKVLELDRDALMRWKDSLAWTW